MVKWRFALLFSILHVVSFCSETCSLEDGFVTPPSSAKPHTWYHMMNGNVTKEGITCDFEALAKAGIGGIQIFDAGIAMPSGPVGFNTPEWFDVIKHAIGEAKRLGLEVCLANCSGWSSSGGPWNTPSNAMKHVVYTETSAQGPALFKARLPRTKEDNGFYEDIAVIAFPTPDGECKTSADVMDASGHGGETRRKHQGKGLRISDIAAKAFWERRHVVRDTIKASVDQVVDKSGIVDITARMETDGLLTWEVPAGYWTILRVGYACNGRKNHPASKYGEGLEVDKLSADAMDFHFDNYLARLCKYLGPDYVGSHTGLNNVLVDSYEVGSQNWTRGLDREFERRMNYPILRYLPVLTGRVVGSVDESERFLEDFRRVIADLFAENYAGRLSELCHRHGLMFSLEPYGSCPSDDLQYGQYADIPMGEFWSRADLGNHHYGCGNSRMAACLAHVWGRRIAATESFTANPKRGGRWLTMPFTIKAQGDRAYAQGVNRIIYHRFVHQPWPNSKYLPGMTMGPWGMHLDRTQTWWPVASEWFRYQSRCQWMLQEGCFVADVLFFNGENVPSDMPNVGGARLGPGNLSRGYNWDICAAKAIELSKVVEGRIVTPGGVSYALLVLPQNDTMSERTLAAIERLIDSGARICGQMKPVRSPGLVGYPHADTRIRTMAERIWSKGVMDCSPDNALSRLGIPPDFKSTENDPAKGAVHIHRRNSYADWYFVALNNTDEKRFEASFRITGRQPEIWNPETGKKLDAASWYIKDGRTFVTLEFPPSGSAFVVFRRPTSATMGTMRQVSGLERTSVELKGRWNVSFPVDWYVGGTSVKSFKWETLKDWTTDKDEDIRYFSGTAVYSRKVHHRTDPGVRTILDLGDVRDFAQVIVNGKEFPPLWRPPFRVDITEALFPTTGIFSLEVKVTNRWPNRLIGDDRMEEDCQWKIIPQGKGLKAFALREIPLWVREGRPSPTGRHTFTSWKFWTKNDALLRSGLLGPVKLQCVGPEVHFVSLRTRELMPRPGVVATLEGVLENGGKPLVGWSIVAKSMPGVKVSPEIVTPSVLGSGGTFSVAWNVDAGTNDFADVTIDVVQGERIVSKTKKRIVFMPQVKPDFATSIWMPPLTEGRTYHVDANGGDDSNDGLTPLKAWRTLQRASKLILGEGERLLLKRGCVFDEELQTTARGASGNWAEIGAYGEGMRPQIRRHRHIDDRCAFIRNPEYLAIRDIVFCNAGQGAQIQFDRSCAGHVLVERCLAHHIEGMYRFNSHGIPEWRNKTGAAKMGDVYDRSYGFSIGGTFARNVTLRDSESYQCSSGFNVGGYNVSVSRFYCHDNYSHNTSPHPYCSASRAWVEDCVFDSAGWHAAAGTMGLMLYDNNGIIIRNCYFLNQPDSGSPDQGGIDFEALGDNILVDGCTFRNNAGAAIEVLGLRRPQAQNVHIRRCKFDRNNYARKNGPSEIQIWGTQKTRQTVACSNGLVEENGYVLVPGVSFYVNHTNCSNKWSLVANRQFDSPHALDAAYPYKSPPALSVCDDVWTDKTNVTLWAETDSQAKMNWAQQEGPSTICIHHKEAACTKADFKSEGDYLLAVTADNGTFFRTARTIVHVLPAGSRTFKAWDFSRNLDTQGWIPQATGTKFERLPGKSAFWNSSSYPVNIAAGGYFTVAVNDSGEACVVTQEDRGVGVHFGSDWCNVMRIKMQNHTDSRKMRLYWQTDVSPLWTEDKSVTFAVKAIDVEDSIYDVRLPAAGRIKQLKLKFSAEGHRITGTCRIDYIWLGNMVCGGRQTKMASP